MERDILLFLHKTIANAPLDVIMTFLTQRGWILWLPIFFFIIIKLIKERNYGPIFYLFIMISLAIFLSDWLSLEIKNIFKRIRPCWTEYFRGVIGCTHSYSLPSNHSSNAFTFGVLIYLFLRGLSLPKKTLKILSIYSFSVASFISISRIYLGVHWPSDILAGALIGAVIGFTVYKVTIKLNSLKHFFYFFLVVLSLFRIYFILHGPIDLSPDEAHYWEWSRRLDLSYYSKGPMIAYLIALSTWLFGNNVFGVRVFAVVCSFLSSIFIYKIGEKLFNARIGYISGILFQLIPLFSVFGVIFTIDSPFLLLWIVSTYIFILAIDGERKKWLWLGLFVGLGLLTKYTMAFFYLCIFTFLLRAKKLSDIQNESRDKITKFRGNSKIFRWINDISLNIKNPMLFLGVIISFVIFLPVLIWNFQNDWVTLKHTAGQAHIHEGFKINIMYFFEFMASQIGVITPLVFFVGFYLILKPTTIEIRHNVRWFLISFSLPIFLFFLLKSIQGKVQANWAMTAYIPLIFTIAIAYDKKRFVKLILSAILTAAIITSLSHAISFLNLPAKIDPTARLKGWKELGIKVSDIKNELEKEGKVIIFSERYQISSELAFYVKNNPKVYCINLGRRMNQYDLWEPINSELLENQKIHGIYVVYGLKDRPEAEVESGFDRCVAEKFTVIRKNVKIRDYTIFRCYNFKGLNLKKPENY